MHISSAKPYKSIPKFECNELPNFLVITGVNGSGKTHLLKAIDEGHFRVDGVTNHETDVRYFNWDTLVPKSLTRDQLRRVSDQREKNYETYYARASEKLEEITAAALTAGCPPEKVESPESLATKTKAEWIALLGEKDGSLVAERVFSAATQVDNHGLSVFGTGATQRKYLEEAKRISGRPLFTIHSDDFDRLPVSVSEADVFGQSFAEMFHVYRKMWQRNALLEVAKAHGLERRGDPLSASDFRSEHGRPPWEFMNDILENAGLDFRVDTPDLVDDKVEPPTFRKQSNDVVIPLLDLSSGEKILLSFALCVYYSSDKRHQTVYPKLLLFDEIDAPLHPSMSRKVIESIDRFLVSENSVRVILVTHSPSTIAAARPESVYTLGYGDATLQKATRQRAVSLLTAGFPTLSMAFDGRRQVIVESKTDAKLLSSIYETVSSRLNSERSLSFISPSKTKNGVEENAGCAQVKSLVNAMRGADCQTVYGLIDHDGKNASSEGVFIVASGLRYAIENLVFDPCIIVVWLLVNKSSEARRLGLPTISGRSFAALDSAGKQSAVNTLTNAVFEFEPSGIEQPSEEVLYGNGQKILIDTSWLRIRGHDLWERMRARIRPLRDFKSDHKFAEDLALRIIPEYPDVWPSDLLNTFQQILDAE